MTEGHDAHPVGSVTGAPPTAARPPLVSCLMVTADRGRLAARALRCFARQSYEDRELVVVDDGREDISPVIAAHAGASRVRHVRLEPGAARLTLGELRNLALQEARGDLVAQWDDDDWYHPARIEAQVRALGDGEACVLGGTLVHVDDVAWCDRPFLGRLTGGVPGTILHRREGAPRHPALARADDAFLPRRYAERGSLRVLRKAEHLFIRCFHGSNIWARRHFLRRLHSNPKELARFLWWAALRCDVFGNPGFGLGTEAAASFDLFLSDCAALGLLGPEGPDGRGA